MIHKFTCIYPQGRYALTPPRRQADQWGNVQIIPGRELNFNGGQAQLDDEIKEEAETYELLKKQRYFGYEIIEHGKDAAPANPEAARYGAEQQAASPEPLSCPECSFKAKSKFGLQSHMRKHEREDAEEAY